MQLHTSVAAHVGARRDRVYNTTLYRTDRLLLGLNCLEPGQRQDVHAHDDQDKFYYVVEGRGVFTLGDADQPLGPGEVAWAPAGIPHGVVNDGAERLVLLMGIAPAP